jgi:phosphoheptose isomerase
MLREVTASGAADTSDESPSSHRGSLLVYDGPVSWSAEIRAYLDESARVFSQVADSCGTAIERAAELLVETFRNDGKLLLCGNGGSAADCQHMAAEFVSRFSPKLERRALPAIALTTDTSILTAFSNDSGYEGVFARQVEAHGRRGDVLVAISTSGNSPNVLAAARASRDLGMSVIALTGSRGALHAVADVLIAIPSIDTQHVQQAHLAVEHLLCGLVENALFAGASD